MSAHKHSARRPATRAELIEHYTEVAIMTARDRAASLHSRQIDAPRLVAQTFIDAFPPDTTCEEIRAAILSPYVGDLEVTRG
jgi:hypothetical protein